MVRTRQWACVLALAATGVCSVGVAWRSALNRGVALDQASAVLAATSLELLPGHTPDYNNDEESDDDAHFNYGDDSTLGSGGRAKMALHMIPTDLYPYAVCNDGSGAGFYYRQGGSDDSGFLIEDPQWLVFLEGGGWCWDQESCAQRTGIYPTLMSSAKWEPEKALSGIFSTDPLSSPLATVCAGACEAACKLAAGCSWLARNRAELVWVGNCPPAACVSACRTLRSSALTTRVRPRSSLLSVLSDLHGDAPGGCDDHGLFCRRVDGKCGGRCFKRQPPLSGPGHRQGRLL